MNIFSLHFKCNQLGPWTTDPRVLCRVTDTTNLSHKSEESRRPSVTTSVGITGCGHIKRQHHDTAQQA